ncbi:hypothetical protein P154DRAFT_411680, partial [Amniculicola lignicola CBS 123094]
QSTAPCAHPNNGTSSSPPSVCPYHHGVLSLGPVPASSLMTPMQRFLNEGPGEQGALFVQGITGELSIHRECLC